MPNLAHSAFDMISGMTPVRQEGLFVFVTTDDPDMMAALSPKAHASFREKEGLSMILPVEQAETAGLGVDHPMACITLNVYSSLEGVGLTAAVASALAENNIPCNMVAAFHHDHVFVPSEKCDGAFAVLETLQKQAQQNF